MYIRVEDHQVFFNYFLLMPFVSGLVDGIKIELAIAHWSALDPDLDLTKSLTR